MVHDRLRGAPKVGTPKLGAPDYEVMLEDGRWKMAAGLLLPVLHNLPPQKAHLKREIMLLQSVLLHLLGFVAPLDWVTPVLSQLCSHLPQLILMRTQLLLLQRQVLDCEVPLSGDHRGASNPALQGSASLKGN